MSDPSVRGTTNYEKGLEDVGRGRMAERCRALPVAMPNSYEELEQRVLEWIATCVQSRTLVRGRPARRERQLVLGNESLRQVWQQLRGVQPGTRVTIGADYIWGAYHVDRIQFYPAEVPRKDITFEPEQITVQRSPDLKEAAHRIRKIVSQDPARLDPEPANRVICMMKLYEKYGEQVDDRFIAWFQIWHQLDMLTRERKAPAPWAVGRLRDSVTRVAGGRVNYVTGGFQQLDQQITLANAYFNNYMVNMHVAGKGDGIELHGLWIRGQQENPRSIYSCYR